MSRRGFIAVAGVCGAQAVAGCMNNTAQSAQTLASPPATPGPVTANIGNRVQLHMFQTGWVAVKKEHKALSGPAAFRFPAIMASHVWTEWLPITSYVIEHPEGLYVVDTGETSHILDPGYAACDPGTGFFYNRNLRFSLGPDDELGPQMKRAGLAPDRVSKVIMTHLHSDHMGGMHSFPKADFLISEAASNGHSGALMCRIPSKLRIRPVSFNQTTAGVFAQSATVSADGAVTIVPTPGHARGHQSVIIQTDRASVCLVGDAAFTLRQIVTREVAGIVENVPDARASVQALKRQYETFDTIMLPTHDPENAARLRSF